MATTVSPPDASLAGLIGNEINRLLRTRWKSPQLLAEELWSIFKAIDVTAGQTQPIAFNAPGNPDTPSLAGTGLGPWQPFMTWRQPDGPVFGLTPSGFTADGIPIEGLEFPQDVTPGEPLVPNPYLKKPPPGGGTAGYITGTGGSSTLMDGQAYEVQLVNGLTVTASCGNLDPSDTVPNGTFVLVTQQGSKYYFYVAMWMGDAT